MARDLHVDTAAEVQEEKLKPIAMVELEFDSGMFRVWSGIGPLSWDGKVFEGVGTLGEIGPIEETIELRAVGANLTLSGIPGDVLAKANAESWQGRPARIYFAALESTSAGRSFVGEPKQLFEGFMDQMNLIEGEQAAIQLACESTAIDHERTRARRYTSEDLRAANPGDAFADQVAALQDAIIKLPTS